MDLLGKFSTDVLKAIVNKKLSELNNDPIIDKTPLDQDVNHKTGVFDFSASGEAGLKILLFNDADDDNGNAVAEELEIEKAIDKEKLALLNYQISGKMKGGVKAEFTQGSLGLEVVGEIAHQSFMAHSPDDELLKSIIDDCTNFRLITDPDKVMLLKNREAVVLQAKGALEFEGSFSVSDSFTPVLSKISKIINATEAISLNVDMKASIEVKFAISDTFQTIIQRRGKKFYISINKAFDSTKSITGSASATAAIKNPEVITAAVNAILDKGESGLTKRIEGLIEKGIANLSDKQKELIAKAAGLLGIDTSEPLKRVVEKYQEKKKKITEDVNKVISTAIGLSVAYTYEQTKEKRNVFKALVPEELLKSIHSNIIRLEVGELFKLQKDKTKGIELLDYLDFSKTSVTRTFKVGLSFGKFDLSQTVKKEDVITTEISANKDEVKQTLSFSNSKFTTERWGIFKERLNSMSLTGSHSGGEDPQVPMKKLDYEFSLQWSENYKKFKAHQIKQVVDLAVTWGIIGENQFAAKESELTELLKGKREFTFSASMKMNKGDFDSIVDNIVNISELDLASIMAASVPFADYFGRRTPSERKFSFLGFFMNFNKDKMPIARSRFGEVISKDLYDKKGDWEKLAGFEGGDLVDPKYLTVQYLLENNFINEEFLDFKKGVVLLLSEKPFQSTVKSNEFRNNFRRMRLQPDFNIRFIGRLIHELSLADNIGETPERMMMVEYTEDDKEQRFIIAK